MSNRFLHIVRDEKFVDFIISTFDSVKYIDNDFIVIKAENKQLTHVKNTKKVIVKTFNEIKQDKFIKILPNYTYTLLHAMNIETLELVERSNKYDRFVWFPWGMDFYNVHKKLRKNLYLRETKKLYNKLYNQLFFKRLIKESLLLLSAKNEFYRRQELILHKIKYIAPVIYEDFEIIKKIYKNSDHLKYLEFSYGDIYSFANENFETEGSDILLGNSGYFTNNHIEILDILYKNQFRGDIYSPMSYGIEKYILAIENYGNKKFSNQFKSLRNFIPIEEYLKIITSCSFVIMNHKRQQAMGNIYAMLFGGAKVFLRRDNPAYRFLKRKNIIVFTISDLESITAFSKLTRKDKNHNKKLIMNLFSPKRVSNYTQNLVDTLLNN